MKASEFTVDGKVLVVKCNDSKCRGCNGLDWSDKTEVDIGDKWNPNPVCDDGGYYGWAWGIGVGSGKQVDVRGVWHVWEVFPGDIVSFDGKAKWKRGKRVFVGCYAEAMKFTMYGRQKLVAEKSKGSASASGDQGSASASGDHGSASASGYRGSASASGDHGSASASGDHGSASASGDHGSASASGDHGSASASGFYGSASASGDYGSASASGDHGRALASGDCGSASASGDCGSASASGDCGSASASGDHGSASASGFYGSASASGDHGSALASGDCGSASASGEMGIASVTCAENFSVVESGVGGICAVIGETFKWKVHIDSVLIQRWESGGKFQTAVLYPKKLKLKTGTTVVVNKGKIAK